MLLRLLSAPFSRDMGIDLGTANSLVYMRGRGVILREPSVVALQEKTGAILAVGQDAKKMIGSTPGNIIAVRPMKDGVIADFDVTEMMLRHFIQKGHKRNRLVRPRVVICVPTGITAVEKRAVIDAALQAGAREAFLIEEPMAAAIGAGLPVNEPIGNLVVDIGGGTTEVALISLGGIVASQSIRVAGDEMDEAIAQYVKNEYKILIGLRTAEDIKIEIGTALNSGEEKERQIRGRDLVSGLPKTLTLNSNEIRLALLEPINSILNAIKLTLEKSPPELSSDIMDRGIILAGGGALLRGLDELIREETGMPVHIAENPLDCIAEGTGKVLEELESLKKILLTGKKLS